MVTEVVMREVVQTAVVEMIGGIVGVSEMVMVVVMGHVCGCVCMRVGVCVHTCVYIYMYVCVCACVFTCGGVPTQLPLEPWHAMHVSETSVTSLQDCRSG